MCKVVCWFQLSTAACDFLFYFFVFCCFYCVNKFICEERFKVHQCYVKRAAHDPRVLGWQVMRKMDLNEPKLIKYKLIKSKSKNKNFIMN